MKLVSCSGSVRDSSQEVRDTKAAKTTKLIGHQVFNDNRPIAEVR